MVAGFLLLLFVCLFVCFVLFCFPPCCSVTTLLSQVGVFCLVSFCLFVFPCYSVITLLSAIGGFCLVSFCLFVCFLFVCLGVVVL